MWLSRHAAHAYLIFWHPSFLLKSLNETSHLLHRDHLGGLKLRAPWFGLEERIKQAEVEPSLGVAAITKRNSGATLVLTWKWSIKCRVGRFMIFLNYGEARWILTLGGEIAPWMVQCARPTRGVWREAAVAPDCPDEEPADGGKIFGEEFKLF